MIFNSNTDRSMGESTQGAINMFDNARDEEINDYKKFIENTDYAYELEENMKKGVKKGIIAYLKKKEIVFDETDDKAIWKALSNCYKCYGFDNDKKRWNSISKNVNNWIKAGKTSTNIDNRKNMYDLCMVLDMNIEETKEFFSRSFFTFPFNYRNRTDAVYYYCIKNKKSCMDTQEILEKAGNENDNVIDDRNTNEVCRQLSDIDNDEEILTFVKMYCYSEGKKMRTARAKIKKLYEESIDAYKKSHDHYQDLEDELEDYNGTDNYYKTFDDLKEHQIFQDEFIQHIYGIDISTKGKKELTGKIPDSIINSLPMYEEISKILNEKEENVSYEMLRKAFIILTFYCYYLDKEYAEKDHIEEEIDDFYSDINKELSEIGFSVMNVKYPFDWLILYCAYTSAPLWSLREYFIQKYGDTRENKE